MNISIIHLVCLCSGHERQIPKDLIKLGRGSSFGQDRHMHNMNLQNGGVKAESPMKTPMTASRARIEKLKADLKNEQMLQVFFLTFSFFR